MSASSYLLLLTLLLTAVNVRAQIDFAQPFKDCGIEGSITLYDYRAKVYLSSDLEDSHAPTLPASTFKILNSLIALETGVIASLQDTVRWPGSTDHDKYGNRPEIYRDLTVAEAFKRSAGWVYVELAKQIGKEQYARYLTQLGYGNGNLSIDDPDFWNFGPFAVSPAEQIELLIGVYEETLPFRKSSFTVLKQVMIDEETPTYTLRGKTGWTMDGGQDTGWWVGYLERDDNVYFFATRIVKKQPAGTPKYATFNNYGKCRKQITNDILRQLGALD